eukprot:366391-Chlamydomonas_euryale.AAC.17
MHAEVGWQCLFRACVHTCIPVDSDVPSSISKNHAFPRMVSCGAWTSLTMVRHASQPGCS